MYHGQPYSTAEVMNGGYGSNNSPDLETSNRINYVIYAILILLPAINLSSMTRSRLRHRVTEIGVRRAFGAKKRSIIMQMFGENLIITLLGGAIGLIFSVLFVWLASSLFFAMTDRPRPLVARRGQRPAHACHALHVEKLLRGIGILFHTQHNIRDRPGMESLKGGA